MSSPEPGLSELTRFAEELPAAIWVGKVPSGECVYTNKEFREILGFAPPPEATRGEYASSYGVFTRDGRPYPEDQMPYERAVRARETVVLDDLVIRRGPKPEVYLRVFARPLFDPAGEITHIVEAFVDITREVLAERARAESDTQLRQAQKMESLGNLAGGVAHDFNNMLAALKILGAQLRTAVVDPPARILVEQINDVTDSAAKLTRALLGFAQRGRHAAGPVSLNELAVNIAEIARRTIDRRIALETDLRSADGVVVGEGSHIEQMILNLVLNARDATTGAGRITLHTRDEVLVTPRACGTDTLKPGPYVLLEVKDTGRGIDPSIVDRVFEPYFTTKTTGSSKGTGLGLATAFGVAQRHGGAIIVADTGPGGTTMRAYFPAAQGTARERRPASGPVRVVRGQGTVLFADDEPIVRGASAEALRSLGYRVITAVDGPEALEIFRANHQDLAAVVLDLVMPGMDGRETLMAMRAIDPRVPIVVTTGSIIDASVRSALDLGARSLLPKPYDPAELSAAVAGAMRLR